MQCCKISRSYESSTAAGEQNHPQNTETAQKGYYEKAGQHNLGHMMIVDSLHLANLSAPIIFVFLCAGGTTSVFPEAALQFSTQTATLAVDIRDSFIEKVKTVSLEIVSYC